MPAYNGTNKFNKIYVGTNEIKNGYIGTTKFFGAEETPIESVTITNVDMSTFADIGYLYGWAPSYNNYYNAWAYAEEGWYNGRSTAISIQGTNFIYGTVSASNGVNASVSITDENNAILSVTLNNTGFTNGYASCTVKILPAVTSVPVDAIATIYFDFYYGICFAEDTGISMADGSIKYIKDINVGDEVLTYSPKYKKHYSKKVIANLKGVGYKYRKITFDNGSILKVYGDKQKIYFADENRLKNVEYFKVGDHCISTLGDIIEIIAIDDVVENDKYHYALVTESGLYLANGVVVGHCDGIQYHFINTNEALKDKYKESIDDYQSRYEYFSEYRQPYFYDDKLAKKWAKADEKSRKKLLKDYQKEMKKYNHKQWKEEKKKKKDKEG